VFAPTCEEALAFRCLGALAEAKPSVWQRRRAYTHGEDFAVRFETVNERANRADLKHAAKAVR